MLQVLKSNERFHTQIGWLDSLHTFSFGEHDDPERRGFRNLRVINEDKVTAGAGFGTHGHRDMEIISYVVAGKLGHKDSTGTDGVIVPGDIQRMSAGTGVMHSEKNANVDAPVHFLQIWLLPKKAGIAPGYAQKSFAAGDKRDVLKKVLVGGADGKNDGDALGIAADVDIYASLLSEGKRVKQLLTRSGHGWVQVIRGSVEVNGTTLLAGDGVAASGEKMVELHGLAPESELLLFDLA